MHKNKIFLTIGYWNWNFSKFNYQMNCKKILITNVKTESIKNFFR